MPKVVRGRLTWGVNGMETHTVEELDRWAAAFEDQARPRHPTSTDDPPWLHRWARKTRRLAGQKEKAREHKAHQRAAGRRA